MKLSIIFLLIFQTTNVCSQIELELKDIFDRKSFQQILVIQTKWKNENRNERIIRREYSEIILNFSGGVIFIGDGGLEDAGTRIEINYLCKGDTIIYYYFRAYVKLLKNDNSVLSQTFSSIPSSYVNKIGMKELNLEFTKIFQKRFSVERYFERYIFGSNCGIEGSNPKEMDSILKLVKWKKMQLIDNFICSSNTTLQIYGLYALQLLQKTGVKLSSKESNWLEIIKEKEGIIHTCFGCIYETKKIKEVLSEFN